MTAGDSADLRWRVIARGSDSEINPGGDPRWGSEQMHAACRWVEEVEPGGALAVERFGAAGHPDDIEASVTVHAADASSAESRAGSLLGQALPSVTFTSFVAVPLTSEHLVTYWATQATARDDDIDQVSD